MQREFTSNDVIALTGITARQLQWWDERGIVRRRKGHRRIYSWDELVTVAVICQVRRRGFSLQRMRKVIGVPEAGIRDQPGGYGERVSVVSPS